MRRIYQDHKNCGFVTLEEDGIVRMALDPWLDVGFGKTAMSMTDAELWQYYDRQLHPAETPS